MKLSSTRLAMLPVLALVLHSLSGPTLLAQSSDENTADGNSTAVATFAGGCFWCMEPPFDKLEGVISTTSGYMGGDVDYPSYDEVSAGATGHYEVVQVEYDPDVVNYQALLDTFWVNVDPFDAGGQFCDRGQQYLSAIFYHDADQQSLARQSKAAQAQRLPGAQQIATRIVAAEEFYPAEAEHQNFYQEHSIQYGFYRWRCGRDDRLEEVWGES